MKIGVYSSPSHTVPHNEKRILAPWTLTEQLVEGLISRGHDVTLFAPEGSKTRARLESGGVEATVLMQSSFSDPKDYDTFVQAQSLLLFRHMIAVVQETGIEVVHVQKAIESLYPAVLDFPKNIPVVCTFHDPIVPARYPALSMVATLPNVHFVSISTSQQKGAPFPFAGVVANGVDTRVFQPDSERLSGGNVLIAGRIVPEKGFADAIEAARASGERLMMVGESAKDAVSQQYFEASLRPAIDGKTVFWESVMKLEHLVGHYQQAKALLFPIHWEEPFGLVMIEAMACGTPVIAYNHGSVPEIVKDGVTGFIVEPPAAEVVNENFDPSSVRSRNQPHPSMKNSSLASESGQNFVGSPPQKGTPCIIGKRGIDGLVEGIKRIGEIDRVACRKHVEENFSIEKMVEGYEKVYRNVLD